MIFSVKFFEVFDFGMYWLGVFVFDFIECFRGCYVEFIIGRVIVEDFFVLDIVIFDIYN